MAGGHCSATCRHAAPPFDFFHTPLLLLHYHRRCRRRRSRRCSVALAVLHLLTHAPNYAGKPRTPPNIAYVPNTAVQPTMSRRTSTSPLLRRRRLTVWPCWASPFVDDSVYTRSLFYLVLACFLSLFLFLPLYLYHSARGGSAPSHV
ncbi:hypothetical protein BKA83DRAFT_546420 [Pisolithus microcarpus]|nr:hypothetical protein BKA83DRAFT_546420 [Pisolithus microcarpus]